MSRRKVEAIRADQRVPVRLEWSDRPPWRVAVDGPFGRLMEEGEDLFSALLAVRRILEADGWLLQVNAARTDAWPSPMARQAGGRKVYLHSMGRPARSDDLVDAFPPIESDDAATVDEQLAFRDRWSSTL